MSTFIHLARSSRFLLSISCSLLLGLLPTQPLQAQSPQSLSHWEKALARQTDSLRKAEVLLYVSKEYEATDPTRAIAYAQHSLEIWPDQQRAQGH